MYRSQPQINNFLRILSGIFCPICQEDKSRSRRFPSTQALLWHLKHEHGDEPKILDISVEEVKEIIRKFDKAVEIGIVRPSMFPRVKRVDETALGSRLCHKPIPKSWNEFLTRK